jgi:phage terminase large subunit-like protein
MTTAAPVRGTVKLHTKGPALWPDYIGADELDRIHRDVGTPIFRTMYQSEEGGLAGEIIDRSYFRYGLAPKPPRTLPFMAVDPAIGKKSANDETAIVIANVVPIVEHPGDPWIFVRWVWAKRGAREREKRDVIVAAWRHYKPVQIGIEAVAYQASILDLLGDDHPELPIVPVTPDADKLSRFLALGALYEFGRIVHHPSLQASAFELQLTKLPHGKHDDMADALAYIATMAGYQQSVVTSRRPRGMP